MKILQITNRIPYPPKDGGAIAMLNMTKAFQGLGQELHLLSLNTDKHHVVPEDLPQVFHELASFEAVDIDTGVKGWKALLNLLFSRSSYNIIRFYSPVFEQRLIEKLQEQAFDIIHIEGLHMCLYIDTIRQHSKAKIALRAHNLEYLIWERLAHAEKRPLRKTYLQVLAHRMRKFEMKVIRKVDALVAITGHDASMFKSLGCKAPVHVSPTGLDMEHYPVDRSQLEWPSIFHLGSLDWLPNQQGIRWFIEQVWPSLRKKYPNLTFYIAGRHMPHWMLMLQKDGIKPVGEVEDAVSFMNGKGIMIVPLLSGSGMRIKIIEGMALAKPIIATTIGAEGINYTDGKNILLADTPEQFVKAINTLLDDRQKAETTGEAARQLVEDKYSNKVLVKDLLQFYERLLKEA